MYDCRENEHQELFHLGVNPNSPVSIHIPSPIGTLGYYVFVCVPADAITRLTGLKMKIDIGGTREDHLMIDVYPELVVTQSKDPGHVWVQLARPNVSRGDGTIDFQGWPTDVTNADVLLCTWPRFVESGMADDWIAAQADPLWAASGVPMGGIGCGRVDICRDGRFRNFSMNNNQDAPLEDPNGVAGAYLAVAMGDSVKDIASRPIVSGHGEVDTLRYESRFPQATLSATAVFPGVDVSVTVSGPFAPHNIKRSSLPGLVIRFSIKNRGDSDATVRCLMGWPNLVGLGGGIASVESGIGYGDGFYRYWSDPTGRKEERIELDGAIAAKLSGAPGEDYIASAGTHILAVSTSGCKAGVTCANGGSEAEGAVTVPAGGEATVTMALAVEMPNWIDSLGVNCGHMWQNFYAGAEEIVTEILAEADQILSEAGALAEHLDDSTLPDWLRARLSNCNYPLVTNSVLYKDGRFSINEGPTEMAGCYGTIDQRLAAHPSTQIFFPELNKTELGLFSAIQGPNGGICHDLGSGHLERQPGEIPWPDLTCSYVIQTARHTWTTGDTELEKSVWPRAKEAIIRHSKWALEGGGVAQVGNGLGTSYDGYHYEGTTGYMATLWIAALTVAEKWARKNDDQEFVSDIATWKEAAVAKLDKDLWNGSHYIAYGNGNGVRRETCHAGQIAGQAFARMLCGQNVLDDSRLKQCVDSIMALNGNERFAVPPDEAASDGTAATEFGWLPYIEGFMLSAIASLGDQRLWPVWERMMKAVDQNGASPCDTRLMYRPESGAPSWGWCYMTAPASWLVYDSAFDFFFTATDGVLRMRSTMPGRFPLVHPLFWGTADVDEDGAIRISIKKVFADSTVRVQTIEVPTSVCTVTVGGQTLAAANTEGDYTHYSLPIPVALAPGAVIEWKAS